MTVRATACGMGTITFTDNGVMVEYALTVKLKAASVVASASSDIYGPAEGTSPDVPLSGVFNDCDAGCAAAIENLMKSDTPALPEPRLQDQIRLTLHRPPPA